MDVSSVMTRRPHLIDEYASILDAAIKMQTTGCGILPVGEYENIVGVITDRDIITRIIAEGSDVKKKFVTNAMSTTVLKCYENDPIKNALQLMRENKTRRILVVNESIVLTGILSITDILYRVKDESILTNLFHYM